MAVAAAATAAVTTVVTAAVTAAVTAVATAVVTAAATAVVTAAVTAVGADEAEVLARLFHSCIPLLLAHSGPVDVHDLAPIPAHGGSDQESGLFFHDPGRATLLDVPLRQVPRYPVFVLSRDVEARPD